MTSLKVGALFAGYLGLEMGVSSVLDTELAWVSEIDKGACKIIAHRFPGVPNIGDITKVDWTQVEPVDVLTGGSPCQDLSTAGGRAGMTEGTRSNLWVAMREAIAVLRPRLVVWENVRGAYSAGADSAVEPCPGCVGDGPGVHLRALGRVLGDLSSLGYDAQWHGLRAADVGAAHGRFRVFVIAQDTHQPAGGEWRLAASGQTAGGRSRADAGGSDREGTPLPTPVVGDGERTSLTYDRGNPTLIGAMLPTPQARDFKGHGPADANRNDPNLSAITHLLPTPAVNDMGEGKTVERWDEWTGDMKTKHANGNGHGKSLAIEAQRSERWGEYAAAITRWESVLGRPAPEPTQTSSKGNPQLSAAFVEFLMGLPAGWITDVPGITRNEALKAAGNGVVPQQAAAALRIMLDRLETAA